MLIGELLTQSAKRFGDRIALVDEDRTYSYAQLDSLANRCANGLRAFGIAPGDRIGILAGNSAHYATLYFGIARAGAVSVHLPVRFAPAELDYALKKVPLAALFIDPALQPLVAIASQHLPARRVVFIDEAASSMRPTLGALLHGQRDSTPPCAVAPESASAILFTSGTTGCPKGAIQPHHGRWLSSQVSLADFALQPDDVLALASPLYHAAGLYTWFQTGICAGTKIVVMHGWDPQAFIAAVERHRITGAFAVPTQLAMLLNHPAFDAQRLASLRLIVYGGAPGDPTLIAALECALPQVRFVQNYGQTETGPLFSQQPHERQAAHDSIGKPNSMVEVAVFRSPGTRAAPGEVGEIATRGAHVALGYFDDAAATRELFRGNDDWAWTGDLAVADAAGLLTLVGRTKDTIIAGGINIYPSELERIAKQHAGVADCAAFGIADSTWGELPALAVVPREGATLSTAEVTALFDSGEQIGRHKRPRAVYFVDALPYTPAGKLLRGELKRKFSAAVEP
jgi:acyl-CoA synthetase (AMP-forming)/AMP-acid ligase II